MADENLNPIPNHPDALATYEYSADGKTLTFTLRDDAYWHNGEKVTPEDIKWSIEFVAKTPVANAVFISTFSAIAGSKTGDTSMTPSAVSLSTGRRSSLPLIRSPPTLC